MEHNIQTENATKWSKLLFLLGIVYLSSGVIAVLPQNIIFDLIAVGWLFAFIGTWLPFPYIIYRDRKKSTTETDWSPSKLYYFGWLPGYIGIFAIFLYLHRRNKAYEQAEESETEVETENQDELDAEVSFEEETKETDSNTSQTDTQSQGETEYATQDNTSYSVFDEEENK